MHRYIARRCLMAVPTMLAATMMIFVILRVLPGDVLAVMFGGQEGDAIQRIDISGREKLMADLKLDRPLYAQYGYWMRDIFTGHFGESFWRGQSVKDLMLSRGPVSVQIAFMSFVVGWLLGLPVGIMSALKQDSFLDYFGRVFTILFLAVPAFWLASLLILGMVTGFGWFPPLQYYYPWVDLKSNLQQTWAPALVLGMAQSAIIARMSRSTILEVMREDFVRTAYSKGLAANVVMWRHTLRNAILPVITVSSVTLGFVLSGSVAVERAFNINGLGLTLVNAVIDRDLNVIQNFVLLYVIIFVFINLVVDLMYAWIDPRIRYN